MRPCLGVHLPLELLLDAIVADRSGRVEGVTDLGLGRFLEKARRAGVVHPDAGVAVGLELGPDQLTAGTLAAAPRAELAEEVLDVVAVLMGDNVASASDPPVAPSLVRNSSKKPRSR